MVVGTLVFAFHYYQRYKFEAGLSSYWWRVRWDEVSLEAALPRSFGTLRKSDEYMGCPSAMIAGELGSHRRSGSRRRGSSRLPPESTLGANVGFYKVRFTDAARECCHQFCSPSSPPGFLCWILV